MDFNYFKSRWLTRNPQELWTTPSPELLEEFDQLSIQEVIKDDIVFTLEDTWKVGLGTGNNNDSQIELSEQDGDTTQNRYVSRMYVVGVLRPKKPIEVKVYTPPTGGLKIDLHLEKIYIKIPLPTYGSPIAASSHTKPKPKKLNPGSYQTDLTKLGMKRIVGDGTDETWINPADNVVQIRPAQLPYLPPTVLDGSIEAKANYVDFKDIDGTPIQRRYRPKPGRTAFTINFENGHTRYMPSSGFTDLAGYTRVGESGYGIPTVCIEDKDGNPLPNPQWWGIRLSDLYEDTTPDKPVKKSHPVSLSDHITEFKERTIKRVKSIEGILR